MQGLNPVAWVTSNVTLVLTAIVALVALAWAYEAYEEAEDRREALSEFGGRAKSGTGGVLNVVLVALVAVVGWAATAFETAGEAVTYLLSVAPEAPMLTASLFTVGLGSIGLSSQITLRPVHFLALSIGAIVLAEAYRRDLTGGSRS